MGLSETILAAMIGAAATTTTALFQIFTAFKARGKVDVKPRRGTTVRSIVAVLALMVASAAGGFLYSELLKQRSSQDIVAMRTELRELKELTASSMRKSEAPVAAPTEALSVSVTQTGTHSAETGGQVESIVYVPACRRAPEPGTAVAPCTQSDAQRVALCGSIPAHTRTHTVDLFAQRDAVQHPWEQHRARLDDDLGGARFTGRSFEYAQGPDTKAVCTGFLQWSSDHPYIARVVIHYGFDDPAAQPVDAPAESVPASMPAVMASESPAAAAFP